MLHCCVTRLCELDLNLFQSVKKEKNKTDRKQGAIAYHFLECERFLCYCECIFAAKIPENGVSNGQL